MILSYAMLDCRKFGVHNEVCTVHAKALKNTKYYIKTALEISKKHTHPKKNTRSMEQVRHVPGLGGTLLVSL